MLPGEDRVEAAVAREANLFDVLPHACDEVVAGRVLRGDEEPEAHEAL